MKTTSDNKEVPARCYYYLLDFNESNKWNLIQEMFNVNQLSYLSEKQFWDLFTVATERDSKNK